MCFVPFSPENKRFSKGGFMGYVLRGSAKTAHRIRKEIHDSKENIATLAACYVFDPATNGGAYKPSGMMNSKSFDYVSVLPS
jgi:hypothetical protein